MCILSNERQVHRDQNTTIKNTTATVHLNKAYHLEEIIKATVQRDTARRMGYYKLNVLWVAFVG